VTPGSSPRAPLRCDGFRSRLNFREELDRDERAAFDRHAAVCRACAQLLLEAERLDDLLLQWKPPGPSAGGEASFEERVMKSVRGEGPAASCAETVASLHHFVADDLEPWLGARVERHLSTCGECSDHLDEVRHSRRLWLGWRAPDPSAGFADALIRRLEPETRAARRRRRVIEFVFGPVRVPRLVAAFVLTSVTLLSLGVLQMERSRAARIARDVGVRPAAHPEGLVHPVSVPLVPVQFAPAGRGDPTGSLSPDVPDLRRGSLRQALRGE